VDSYYMSQDDAYLVWNRKRGNTPSEAEERRTRLGLRGRAHKCRNMGGKGSFGGREKKELLTTISEEAERGVSEHAGK